MDELERYRRRRAQSQRRLKTLGVMNVRCLCGETDPICFDADHVGRKKFDPVTVWGRCANCHRKISARQSSEHPSVGLHSAENPFARHAHALLGMHEYVAFIDERLLAMSDFMLMLADKGITIED